MVKIQRNTFNNIAFVVKANTPVVCQGGLEKGILTAMFSRLPFSLRWGDGCVQVLFPDFFVGLVVACDLLVSAWNERGLARWRWQWQAGGGFVCLLSHSLYARVSTADRFRLRYTSYLF